MFKDSSNSPPTKRSRIEEKKTLVDLPYDIFPPILSFLSIKERLKCRVTRRLDEVELKTHHNIWGYKIEEISEAVSNFNWERTLTVRFPSERETTKKIEGLRRINNNYKFKHATLRISGSKSFHSQLLEIVADIRANVINMFITDEKSERGLINDDCLLLISTNHRSVLIGELSQSISAEGLKSMCEKMANRSVQLKDLFMYLPSEVCISFLNLMGVLIERDSHEENKYISFTANRDVEIFRSPSYSLRFEIFIGLLHITIAHPNFLHSIPVIIRSYDTKSMMDSVKENKYLKRVSLRKDQE